MGIYVQYRGVVSLPPLSLYIHFPWCIRKCPYCDFNSHEVRDGIPEDAYIDALLADLQQDTELLAGKQPLQSIFMGGGTPSLFSPAALERLLAGVKRLLPLAEDCEITLEANPGTFESAKFQAYRQLGNAVVVPVVEAVARHMEAYIPGAAKGRVREAPTKAVA